ncbi:MAG: aminopeptidase P family protein [Lachnospiraceae bacterium]|nr:aminopeptidase P family protein [Lachnospiraceae bacterium]
MNIYLKRLQRLRDLMQKYHIDYYLITTQDYHNSEYVHDYFKEREYISGFTGSNGTLLVSMQEAYLWTDGRYYLQAESELKDTTIMLCKQEKGHATIEDFLEERMTSGQCLGCYGQCLTAAYGEKLEKICENYQASIKSDLDLPRMMWDSPDMPCNPIWVLEDRYTGKSSKSKLKELRDWLSQKGGKYYFSSKLDDIMWLYNIRGNDVECNPVALSYTWISEKEAYLFIQKRAVTKEVQKYFEENEITVVDYTETMDFIKAFTFQKDDVVVLHKKNISYSFYKALSAKTNVLDEQNILEKYKSIKNKTELEHIREAYLYDSVAVCRFIAWVKEAVKTDTVTEISAATYLDDLRKELPGFLGLSFPTICGYKENAAIVHYEATPKTNKKLKPEGMLLVDSGGQYLKGTTDVTRTIVLGRLTEEEKEMYCAVVAGMLRLADAVFLEGCTGRNLDILARELLWKRALDYKHGTGHGIGHVLNVHEGPQSLRWNYIENMTETILCSGMLLSDEPGIYLAGKFGIRLENILEVTEDKQNEYGQFLKFHPLTYVPLDRDALDKKYLSKDDILRINKYHQNVYQKILPFLTSEAEKEWLRNETNPIDF